MASSKWQPRLALTKLCDDAIALLTDALYGGDANQTNYHHKRLVEATYNWADREVAELVERYKGLHMPEIGSEDKPQ